MSLPPGFFDSKPGADVSSSSLSGREHAVEVRHFHPTRTTLCSCTRHTASPPLPPLCVLRGAPPHTPEVAQCIISILHDATMGSTASRSCPSFALLPPSPPCTRPPLSLSLSLLIQTQRATAMMFWKEFPPCPSSNPPSRWVHLHLECASFALIALGNVPPPLGAQSIRRSPTPLARASIQCPSLGE